MKDAPVALFTMEGSVYASLEIECFDEKRDARTYSGTSPVIAHPPCQLWGKMAIVNFSRWGGEHNRPGNDGGCFAFAKAAVDRCGGVLEHPAQSYAWPAHGLHKPVQGKWSKSGIGWVCEVWQSAYGHRANKKTWLYYVGDNPPIPVRTETPSGSHQIGFQDQRGKSRNKPTLSRKEANATPVEFAKYLINLAEWSRAKL